MDSNSNNKLYNELKDHFTKDIERINHFLDTMSGLTDTDWDYKYAHLENPFVNTDVKSIRYKDIDITYKIIESVDLIGNIINHVKEVIIHVDNKRIFSAYNEHSDLVDKLIALVERVQYRADY